jgi:hypothetical protein
MEDVASIYKVNLVHSCHASSFINPNKQKGFTNKEELYAVNYSLYDGKEGTKFPWTKH